MTSKREYWLCQIKRRAVWGVLSCLLFMPVQAEEAGDSPHQVQASGSLVGSEPSIRMSINSPYVKRQMAIRSKPAKQSIDRPQREPSADVVRIEVPPGSHKKENDSPFFQFRQLPSDGLASPDGEFLSREARKHQVERYRQSLLSNKD